MSEVKAGAAQWWMTPNTKLSRALYWTVIGAGSVTAIWMLYQAFTFPKVAAQLNLSETSFLVGEVLFLMMFSASMIVIIIIGVLFHDTPLTPLQISIGVTVVACLTGLGISMLRQAEKSVEDLATMMRPLHITRFVDRMNMSPSERQSMIEKISAMPDAALCQARILPISSCPGVSG